MIKRNTVITVLIIISLLPVNAQVKKQETGLKREVTLYNPYKPSLPDTKKMSFLPDLNDTTKIRPDFRYDVKTNPFLPQYTISPIKAAALLPDPLTKLYKSYLNIGIGNYLSPLAEISITNERSKKGSVGFYGRHFSTNGNVELDNRQKAFAGYMDNDLSLFGKRFLKNSKIEGSLDYNEKTRYAYGYDPDITNYSPSKKEIRLPYNNLGAKASLSSLTLDSTDFAYNYDISYNYFTSANDMNQHKLGLSGRMAKLYKGFYIGSELEYDHYRLSDILQTSPKYIFSISPFLKKSSGLWSFKLGIQALLDKNLTSSATFHFYPDADFSLTVVPSYVTFFAGLSGKLEKNEPMKIVSENPYLLPDGSLYKLPNTSHDLIISTGLKGNTGMGGNYAISASYSTIRDMLFYSNIVIPDTVFTPQRGNYFSALSDDVELLNIHAEMGGPINDKLSFNVAANLYHYTLSKFDYAWNKPDWDGKFGLKYNLRNKIIAGFEITGQGVRREIVNGDLSTPPPDQTVPANVSQKVIIEMPVHFNLNLNAEYRYSKILSFWTKLNNISNNHYYDWAYYPTHGLLFMLGLTYSL
jgi:hypothetical protein